MRRFGFNINFSNSPEEIVQLGEQLLKTGEYQAIEVTYYENMQDVDTYAYNNAIRTIVAQYHPQVVVHVSGFNLSEENSVLRAAILHEIGNCCKYTAELGGKEIVLHVGQRAAGMHVPLHTGPRASLGSATPEETHARAWTLSVKLMRLACAMAKEYDITVYTENLNGSALTVQCDTLRQFIDDVGCDNLAIVFDIGHCHHMGGDIVADVHVAGEQLRHLHLHDNHGERDEHLPVGEGDIDFSAFGRALCDVEYNGLYMMELSHCTPDNLTRAKERLLQCL